MQWRRPSVKSSETTEGDSQLIRPRYVRKRQCKRVQQKNFLKHNYPIGHIYDELCNLNGCEELFKTVEFKRNLKCTVEKRSPNHSMDMFNRFAK